MQIQEEYTKYVMIRNRVNKGIDEIKQKYWEQFAKDVEHDIYGA